MKNLMVFFRWMERKPFPVLQLGISIRNGVLCCGDPDTTHPEDTYQGGGSYDGW